MKKIRSSVISLALAAPLPAAAEFNVNAVGTNAQLEASADQLKQLRRIYRISEKDDDGQYMLFLYVAHSGDDAVSRFNAKDCDLECKSTLIAKGREEALNFAMSQYNTKHPQTQLQGIKDRTGVDSEDMYFLLVTARHGGDMDDGYYADIIDKVYLRDLNDSRAQNAFNAYRREAGEMIAAPAVAAPADPVAAAPADPVGDAEAIAAERAVPFQTPQPISTVKLLKGQSPQEAIVSAYLTDHGYLVPVESRVTFARAVIKYANSFKDKKHLGAKKRKGKKRELLDEERLLADTVISLPDPKAIGFELKKIEGERSLIDISHGDNVYKRVSMHYVGEGKKLSLSRYRAVLAANGITDEKKIPVGPLWLPPHV